MCQTTEQLSENMYEPIVVEDYDKILDVNN